MPDKNTQASGMETLTHIENATRLASEAVLIHEGSKTNAHIVEEKASDAEQFIAKVREAIDEANKAFELEKETLEAQHENVQHLLKDLEKKG
ncbi:MAG: hypothetical protein M3209_00860 [Acidobacteriota bacterium]|nr:hypothetical protein [Acidobacteriota bacterium]